MKLCIAGKNNIAVDSVKYLLSNNLISKNKLLILPNNDDNGIDDWQNSLKKYSKKQNLGITKIEETYSYKLLIFISFCLITNMYISQSCPYIAMSENLFYNRYIAAIFY